MNKNIEITVTKEDYFKAVKVVTPYVNGWMSTILGDCVDKIIFPCRIFKSKRCKRDIDLAIALGVNIKMES